MTLTARPRFLIRFAALAALALCGIVLALSSTGTPPVGAQDGSAPAKPTGVVATATHDSVALAWDDPSDASITHYQIFRRDRDVHDAGEFVTIQENTGSAAASYTDDTVEPEKRYVYRVKAVNQHGASTWSDFVRADTPAAPDPADLAPSGLEVSLVENRVTLTWDAPASDAASVTGYEILRRRPNDGEAALTTLVADTGNAETGYTDDTANEPGVRYTYRVKALRDGEQSKVSNYDRIDLPDDYAQDTPEPEEEPSPEALAPSGLTAEAAKGGGVALSWTAPTDDAGSVTGYEVLRAQGSAEVATLVADTGSTGTAYTDETATAAGETYAYQVKALRGGEKSQGSNEADIDLPDDKSGQESGDLARADEEVLVSNTGQSNNGYNTITSTTPKRAQAFTTGTNGLGYTLSSIGLSFGTISSDSNPTSELTATLNKVDGSNPGDVICTLTDPASYVASSVNTYQAPAARCPTLTASTTYFFVLSRANDTTSTIQLDRTNSTSEDADPAAGWSIADSRRFFTSDAWASPSDPTAHRIAVTGAAVDDATMVVPPPTEVPSTWSLIPSGLGVGDEFRLLFVSSTTRNATPTGISTYNTWIQNQAAAGHTDIQDYSDTFRVVGCTAAVDARDNTRTTYTSSDKGLPIYWLNGNNLADDYEDFYDGDWDDQANPKTEAGSSTSATTMWTGCDEDGTESFTSSGISRALGKEFVAQGVLNHASLGPVGDSALNGGKNGSRPFYGLSAVFRVVPAPPTVVPADWSLIPSGLVAGQEFRLLFLSSTKRSIRSTNISDYNTFVQNRAAAGHTDIQDYSDTFRVLGSTGAVDARDNTGTTYTSSEKGVRIYWLNGDKAADQYEDFYDGSWDQQADAWNESGVEYDLSARRFVATGSSKDGTADQSNPLGASSGEVQLGCLYQTSSTNGPVWCNFVTENITADDNQQLYGLSGVFQVTTNNATGKPVITGTPEVKQTLTADISGIMDEDGLPAADQYSYQWIRSDGTDDSDISGATDSTYKLKAADQGKTIKVRVTFTDEGGTEETLTSDATTAVAADTTGPVLTGARVELIGFSIHLEFDENLDTDLANLPQPGDFTVTTDGVVGTVETTVLTAAATHTLFVSPRIYQGQTVIVTYSDPTSSNDENAIQDEAGNDAADFTTGEDDVPAVTNNSTVARVAPGAPTGLTATPNGATQIDLAWTAPADNGGEAITGYQIEYSDDGGTSWSVLVADTQSADTMYSDTTVSGSESRHYRVSAINSIGIGAASNSPPTGKPAITGTPEVKQTLTADISGIVDTDGLPAADQFSYQWIRNDGTDDSDISGATDSTYKLKAADLGKTIKVKVTFTDEGGTEETLTSDATTAVAADTTGPTLTTARVELIGFSIHLEFDENLDTDLANLPQPGDFTVTTDGVVGTVETTVLTAAATHTLFVSPRIYQGQTVIVTYSDPTSSNDENAIQDEAGNDAADFTTGEDDVPAVTNNSTVAPVAPDAPTGLTATASGGTQIDLAWTAPADNGGRVITGYQIEYSDDAGTSWSVLVADTQSTDTIYSDTTLSGGDTRHYRVSAINSIDTGAASTVANATTPSGPGVASVTVDQASITQTLADVTVTVANLQNASHTVYLRYRVAGGSWPAAANQSTPTSGTAVTFTLSGLIGNTEYDVAASLDSAFASGVKTASFTTSPTKPGKTRSVDVTTSGNGTLFITWQAPDSDGGSAITGYKVQWKSGSQSFGDPSREHTTEDTFPDYLITGLTNGTEYTVRVIAVNAVGDGPPSDTTTGTPEGPPDAPPNVQAGSGHQQLTVSWGAPNDGGSAITEYTLQWKSGGQSFNSTRQRTIAGTSRTDIIPSLTNGTEYTVRVRATTALGDSGWSAEVKGTPREGPHVSTVRVKEPISCTVTFVALDFVNLEAATEYQAHLRFRAQGSASWTVLSPQGFWSSGLPSGAGRGELNGPSPAFTLTDLAYETTYEVQAALDSGFVDGLATTTFSTPNLSEVGLTPLSPGDGTLGLRMTRPTSEGRVVGYLLQWKSGDEEYDDTDTSERQADVPGPGDREYTITGLDNGVEYTVRAMAYNDNGVGVPSSEVRGTPEAPPNSPARGAPTISGTAQVGETLTADTDGIEDDDGLADAVYSYQWLADGADISGATGETYTPAYDDERKVIRVKVSFADDRDFEETLTSEPTAAVEADPDAPTEPPNAPRTVRIVGDTNTSLTLTWDAPDGGTAVTEYRVQWLTQGEGFAHARRDGREAVVDASARSHTITGLTMYGFYQVRVLAVNGAGESEGSNTAWGFPGLGEGQYGP